MLGQTTVIGLTKLADYSKYVLNYTYTDNPILADGQYTFDVSQRAFRANKTTLTSKKINVLFSQMGIREIHIGDVVEIELQCKNISGDKFRVGIDNAGANEETYISTKTNEWELMHIKHIVRSEINTSSSNSNIAFGLWSSFTGEFMARDIVISVTTKADNNILTFEPWKQATLLEGWTGIFDYAKNGVGQVRVRLELGTGSNVSPGVIIANLPSGYAPSRSFPIPVFKANVSPYDSQLGMLLLSNGNVVIRSPLIDGLIANKSDATLTSEFIYYVR